MKPPDKGILKETDYRNTGKLPEWKKPSICPIPFYGSEEERKELSATLGVEILPAMKATEEEIITWINEIKSRKLAEEKA